MAGELPGTVERTVDLVELTGFDPVAGAEVADYLATDDVQFPDDEDAPAVEYLGALASRLTSRQSIVGDDLAGDAGLPTYGQIVINIDDTLSNGDGPARWMRSAFDGRRVRWLRGSLGASYANYRVMLEGLLSGERTITRKQVSFALRDPAERLARSISGPTYAGTGGMEGGTDLAGRRKPEIFGIARNVTPVEVDAINRWYDVSWSGLSEIYEVADGLVPLTESLTSPPAAGYYYADLANGRVQVSSRPQFGLTVSARGAAAGGATGVGDLVSWLLEKRLGFDASEIDTAAWAALQADWPHALQFYTGTEETEGRGLIDLLAVHSTGAWYAADDQGRITCGQLTVPVIDDPDDADLAIDQDDIMADTLQIAPMATPPSGIDVGYDRCWTVVTSETSYAGAATDAAIAFAKQDYRLQPLDLPAVTAIHLSADRLRVDTALDTQAGASALATRMAEVEGRDWLALNWTVLADHPALRVGATVWLSHDELPLDLPVIITGIEIEKDRTNVEARAWL